MVRLYYKLDLSLDFLKEHILLNLLYGCIAMLFWYSFNSNFIIHSVFRIYNSDYNMYSILFKQESHFYIFNKTFIINSVITGFAIIINIIFHEHCHALAYLGLFKNGKSIICFTPKYIRVESSPYRLPQLVKLAPLLLTMLYIFLSFMFVNLIIKDIFYTLIIFNTIGMELDFISCFKER